MSNLSEIQPERVDPKVLKRLNTTLCLQLMCRGCSKKCPLCKSAVPCVQLKIHNECAVCVAGRANKKQKR